jgi:hypothetical protein
MSEIDSKPHDDDLRNDDQEYNPAVEPKSAKAWLNLLQESEDAFESWNAHCDNIDKLYASLERLGTPKGYSNNMTRSKEFQLFWANCEVIKPAIYAKAPVPVVVPKFKDRRPVYQEASEVMERCCAVAFDLTRINDLMLLVRDDVALVGRGVAWCRYESSVSSSYYNHEKVCIDYKGRRDFLHSVSRNWREVTWVAAASYLTRTEARKRFEKHSGDEYQRADYRVDRDSKAIGGADNRERARFWEIWHKGSRRVVWVAEGCEDILDEDEPHLDLQNFFPCPMPAYGTLQRGSLVPVPDVMQYRDQLDEINLLTARIHALSDALEAKGFYPAGGAELAEAVQAAVAAQTDGRLLVPISNWAAFGGTKDIIVWMPIDMIATTITACVALRKQIIDDIYQITGMADIMRGDTDPNETLGAQQMKAQYGTTRIRDKQHELARVARDLVEIVSEIITEKFKGDTIVEMSQTQLPTKKMVEQQMRQLAQQAQQIQQAAAQIQQQIPGPGATGSSGQPMDPQFQQQTQKDEQGGVEQFQKAIQAIQQEMQRLQQQPTIDQVLELLKDSRVKSFVLDIETDSTIMGDEMAEKASRNEFMQTMGSMLQQMGALVAADPNSATFCGELLKFGLAPYRAGRALDGAVDDFVEQVKAKGAQGQGDDPTTALGKIQLQIEQMKQQTELQKAQMHQQIEQSKLQQNDQHKQWELANQRQIAQMKMSGDSQDAQVDMAVQGQKMQESREAHQAQLAANQQKMQLEQQKAAAQMAAHQAKAQAQAAQASQRQAAAQLKQQRPV